MNPSAPARPRPAWAAVCDALPPVAAAFKSAPEDFVVEERPLFEPEGTGEHLHLRVRKVGVTTDEVVGRLSRALGVDRREIGYAGQKDKHAVAVQSLSVPGVTPAQVAAVELPGVEVLAATPHPRKLRRGQSAGNQFAVVLREIAAGDLPRVEALVDRVRSVGLANYFGPQRFGGRGVNHLIGAALLAGNHAEAVAWLAGRPLPGDRDPRIAEARARFDAGDYDGAAGAFPGYLASEKRVAAHLCRRPGDFRGALRALGRGRQGFFLTALQSYLFNVEVDVAVRAGRDRERPFGQLPGHKTLRAPEGYGDFADAHRARLEAIVGGDPLPALRKAKLAGERRRVWLDLEVTCEAVAADAVCLRFDLPKGSFATALVREITRDDPPLLELPGA